jgi:hypothetical protein
MKSYTLRLNKINGSKTKETEHLKYCSGSHLKGEQIFFTFSAQKNNTFVCPFLGATTLSKTTFSIAMKM